MLIPAVRGWTHPNSDSILLITGFTSFMPCSGTKQVNSGWDHRLQAQAMD